MAYDALMDYPDTYRWDSFGARGFWSLKNADLDDKSKVFDKKKNGLKSVINSSNTIFKIYCY